MVTCGEVFEKIHFFNVGQRHLEVPQLHVDMCLAWATCASYPQRRIDNEGQHRPHDQRARA